MEIEMFGLFLHINWRKLGSWHWASKLTLSTLRWFYEDSNMSPTVKQQYWHWTTHEENFTKRKPQTYNWQLSLKIKPTWKGKFQF